MGFFRELRNAQIKGYDAARGVARGLRQVTSHGDLEVDDSDSGLSVGRVHTPPTFIAVGSGVIAETGDDGEEDYDDPRYFVRWTMPLATTNGSEVWTMAVAPTRDPAVVTALNLAEMDLEPPDADTPATGTHRLKVGQQVILFVATDEYGRDRYFFNHELPRIFVCLVTTDGGTAGSDSTTCDLTYTVDDLDGNELDTGLTPKRPRLANVEYETPAADSPGLAYYDAAGDLQLYEAVEEIPKSDACT